MLLLSSGLTVAYVIFSFARLVNKSLSGVCRIFLIVKKDLAFLVNFFLYQYSVLTSHFCCLID